MTDEDHMRAALSLAARGLGQTAPNPSVGCVIVDADGSVVGRGTTAPGGRPHAEVVALRMAGAAARGGTAYVTLEPCSHVGQTPPCADALIVAGIARVVVAATDLDPRVNGAGLARLRAAGVAVTEGVLAAAAETLGAGFATRVRLGRPLVTLKLASTLDGRIATAQGESRWITGPAARRAAHFLRATHDAILIGVGTMLADDPDLTCRLPGARAVPLRRIVADSTLRTPLTAAGARVLPVAASDHGIDLAAGLAALGADGLTRLLVEGGGGIAASLLRAGLVDRLAWFHAPAVMGGDGWPAAAPLGLGGLADIPRFVRTCVRPVGDDLLTIFHRE